MEPLAINTLISREMKRNHVTVTNLARKLGVKPSSVLNMLNRSSMQVERLMELSQIFNYNFFLEIAQELSCPEPKYSVTTALVTEKEEMKDRIKSLEMEVAILRQTLKDVVTR